ncbi:MAG: hypothetical protein KJ674_02820 [Nanoarchaeota archaeon]|nr:hypothetical protein [Nanoarchaeota archaeon]
MAPGRGMTAYITPCSDGDVLGGCLKSNYQSSLNFIPDVLIPELVYGNSSNFNLEKQDCPNCPFYMPLATVRELEKIAGVERGGSHTEET